MTEMICKTIATLIIKPSVFVDICIRRAKPTEDNANKKAKQAKRDKHKQAKQNFQFLLNTIHWLDGKLD